MSRSASLQASNSKRSTPVCKILALSVFAAAALNLAPACAAGLEIVFTDSQAAVLRADALASGSAIISTGGKLMQPFGIAVGKRGEFFVSDTGSLGLLGINQLTGEQRWIARGGMLGVPFGIAAERSGTILVANGASLLRIDPETGAQSLLASAQGMFRVPLAVAVAISGDIFVADALGPIFRVNSRNGAQTLVSSGGYLQRPQGIAVTGNEIYVTDIATSDLNFGVGRVIRIDVRSGQQSILSEAGLLVGPVGITVQLDGNLIVGDPYTINPESTDLFDGAIIRIDKNTGAQKLIARGSDNFVNPRGVAVVQNNGN